MKYLDRFELTDRFGKSRTNALSVTKLCEASKHCLDEVEVNLEGKRAERTLMSICSV